MTVAQKARRDARRELRTAVAVAVLVVTTVIVLLLRVIDPAPPSRIVIAAGENEAAFRYFARRYQDELARHGVVMEVRGTSGSAESLRLLADGRAGVLAAFVQGGIDAGGARDLVSLGALTLTPLWIFHRGERLDDLGQLRGRRLAVGTAESACRALSVKLLAASGALDDTTELVEVGREAAARLFLDGGVDALFLIGPAESAVIQEVAAAPGVRLLSLARAEAYVRRYPYLHRRVLPMGTFDLAANLPAEDVHLVSPAAKLVARADLHPALAYLLMRTATEVHDRPTLLERAGEFPAAHAGDFELSEEARRYYRSGPPLLQRFLPYWAANLVDRLWVMVVPILALVLPLIRAIPPIYRWRVRSRIYRWYARLKEVELELERDSSPAMLRDMLRRTAEIDDAVNHIPTPLAFSETLYSFRQHIELVRRKVVERLAAVEAEGQPGAA